MESFRVKINEAKWKSVHEKDKKQQQQQKKPNKNRATILKKIENAYNDSNRNCCCRLYSVLGDGSGWEANGTSLNI